MSTARFISFATALVLILGTVAASGGIPPVISYQGKLTQPSKAPVADGAYSIQFAIYDVPTGGTALWSETNPSVQVKDGLFSVLLGSVVNLPANIFDSPDRYLGVKVGTDAEMTPRQQIASVPFAYRAAAAGTVDDGSVSAEKLATSAITLGYAQITNPFGTTAQGWTDVPGLSVQVNVPPGGRRIKITVYSLEVYLYLTDPSLCAGNSVNVSIREGGTDLQQAVYRVVASHLLYSPCAFVYSAVPSAGLHTYKVSVFKGCNTGTLYFEGISSAPAFILVELI
jgi:hypothetical protein